MTNGRFEEISRTTRVERGPDERVRLFTDSPFEALAGYSRALRVGDLICVSGTTAMIHGEPYAPGDAVQQTRCVLELIEGALRRLGASGRDVIRYRVYLVDMTAVRGVATELGRAFGDARPASTLVGITALADPRLMVEIEVDAWAPPSRGTAHET